MKRVLALALFAVAAPAAGQPTVDWRQMASDTDRMRLRDWRGAWMRALGAARAHGAARVAMDPTLFDPDRAMAGAMPPLGRYRCRRHQLRAAAVGGPVVEDWRPCRIEQDKALTKLVVEGGAQRPIGLIYPDTGSRAVFLGSLTIGDERRALRYGRDRQRDLAGIVERIDPRRWRLAIPSPSFGGTLDLIELVPG